MTNWMKKSLVVMMAVFLLSATLWGCGSSHSNTAVQQESTEIPAWMSTKEASVTYEMPELKPLILVDQIGYLTNSEKYCFFQEIEEASSFEVVCAQTKEVIYTGELKETEEKNTFYGDFSKLTVPGTYYIQTEYLGESYPFVITDTTFDGMKQEFMGQLSQYSWDEEVEESCMIINTLLLAYELYPETFQNNQPDEIPQILKICSEGLKSLLAYHEHTTGAVYPKDLSQNLQEGMEDLELTAVMSGTLAKFCYLYGDYDAALVTEWKDYATLSYQYIEKELLTIPLDQAFFASAEMYRLTGQWKYRSFLDKNLPKEQAVISEGKYDYAFFANITYLCTPFKVNVSYCNLAINHLIREAGKITEESQKETYLVRNDKTEFAILKDATAIVFASRVNYNFEYVTVIENHMHYLAGMNPTNHNYLLDEDSYINTTALGKSMAIMAYSLLE